MMKNFTTVVCLLASFLLAACSVKSVSKTHSTSSQIEEKISARPEDLFNCLYTLKQPAQTNLNQATIAFTKTSMKWQREIQHNKPNDQATDSKQLAGIEITKTRLSNLTTTAKDDQYQLIGTEDGQTQTLIFTKVGKNRIKDEAGNIYGF